jgi:predicted ATP-grasp superfamily ATP-dependent carboligase
LRRPAIADVEQIGDARARLDEIVISGLAGVGTFGAIACAVNIDDVFANGFLRSS